MKTTIIVTLSIFFYLANTNIKAQTKLEYSTRKNTLEWFEGARLGIFLHWDARSNCGLVNDGEFNVDIRPETKALQEQVMWGKKGNKSDKKPWESWNPSKFNADEWIKIILESGAKYCTFITMHMWCFSNFDHPATTYDIMSTPYGKDVAAQIAKAARGKIPVFWYYNMYPEKHITGDRKTYFDKFINPDIKNFEQFRAAGILKLITDTVTYGKVAGIWCDGGGTFTDKGAKYFYSTILDYQPWLIFTPRHGNPYMPKDYRVPEQKMSPISWDMQQEMTMPIESDIWFWAYGKKSNTKDVEYTIQTLIQTATRDANLQINVSPRGDGIIDPYQAKILRGIGKWMKKYGESIYGTRGGPYEPGVWGGSTRKGNKVFLHLTQLSQNGKYVLPALPAKIVSYRLLNGGAVDIQQTSSEIIIALDKNIANNKNVVDRIVELKLSKDAWDMLPKKLIKVNEGNPIKATAIASSENEYLRPSEKKVIDSANNVVVRADQGHGGWTASEPWSKAGLDKNPWIMLDLGKEKKVQTVYLKEYHSRIQEFVVEYKNSKSEKWISLFAGNRLNHLSYKLASPVITQFVRVRFVKNIGGAPQLSNFRVY